MTFLEVIFLSVILSFDAFLVSFSYGTCELKRKNRTALYIAFGVAFFQFLMPLIGAFFTNLVFEIIKDYATYLAGIIFLILGIKLFLDAQKSCDAIDCNNENLIDISWKTIFIISIATSIDALAAGSSLYILKTNVLISSLTIGIITFINSLIGFYIGHYIKNLSTNIIGKCGGILLFLLGLKTIFS